MKKTTKTLKKQSSPPASTEPLLFQPEQLEFAAVITEISPDTCAKNSECSQHPKTSAEDAKTIAEKAQAEHAAFEETAAKKLVFKQAQFLVSKFVKEPNFAREIKIAKKLLVKFPNFNFWKFKRQKEKFDSLCSFLSPEGQKIVAREYEEYTRQVRIGERVKGHIPERFVFGDTKIGEDYPVKPKPKSILSWLRNQ